MDHVAWHSLPVRVYYEDTDAQGVVYFANYQRFMERGRTEWLRDHGISQEVLHREHRLFFSLTSSSVKYRLPAVLDDQLVVRTRVDRLRGASITFAQEVRRAPDPSSEDDEGELLTNAECVAACVDADSLKARRLPDELKALLAE